MKGLILEGGGVKGSYQVGAFYAFRDSKVKLDGFVGTSIGSFNAAMLASNKYSELLDFWYNVNPGELLGFDKNFIDIINNDSKDIESLISAFSALKKVVKNLGIDNTNLLNNIKNVLDFDALNKSSKDFGLVTVQVSKKGAKPVYVYKSDIKSKDKLIEYLMASSYLPVFREKRIIDDHFYIDGGFYDNSPVKLLTDIGYDEVYVINIKGIGINRRHNTNAKVINISPSRDNGKILEFDRDVIRDNIMMGYYDTLRVLKRLDGYRYCFKRRNNKYYKFLVRKVDKRLFKRVMNFFDTNTYKTTVLKALEYVLEKEHIDYYDVYESYKLIKKLRDSKNKHFVYRFIREIRFF